MPDGACAARILPILLTMATAKRTAAISALNRRGKDGSPNHGEPPCQYAIQVYK